MCDTVKVQNKVAEFVAAGKVFTAYDVTKALREDGLNERHRHVRREIHRMFSRGEILGYDRTPILLDVKGVSTEVLVYHPQGVAAETHPMATTLSAPASAVCNGPANDLKPLASGVTVNVTKKQLEIPQAIVGQVQGAVIVNIGGNTAPANKDARGRVRIARSLLDATRSSFNVTYDQSTDSVVVS